jgi:hypothetical protein
VGQGVEYIIVVDLIGWKRECIGRISSKIAVEIDWWGLV